MVGANQVAEGKCRGRKVSNFSRNIGGKSEKEVEIIF